MEFSLVVILFHPIKQSSLAVRAMSWKMIQQIYVERKVSFVGSSKFRWFSVMTGCIHNVLESNLPCQSAALDCGLLSLLSDLLSDRSLSSCHETLLSILCSITEHAEFRQKIMDSTLPRDVLRLLDGNHTVSSPEITEFALDFLADVAVSAGGLLLLMKHGAGGVLISFLQNFTSSIPEAISKKAENLLVELLADLSSVALLPDQENDTFLSTAVIWLTGYPRGLSRTGALIIANLARDRKNCIRIFDAGLSIPGALLHTLENANRSINQSKATTEAESTQAIDPAMQLQFAVLSALKNLAVEEDLRQRLIDSNLLVTLTEVLGKNRAAVANTDKNRIPVVGKVFTLLRMCAALNEAAAKFIASNEELVEIVLRCCTVPALSREAIRVLIALLSYPGPFHRTIVQCLWKHGMVNVIRDLTASSTLLDQIGALVLLNATVSTDTLDEADFAKEIAESDLIQNVNRRLCEEDLDKTILLQSLQFFEKISNSAVLREILQSKEIFPVLQPLQSHSEEAVRKIVERILDQLSS